MRTIILLLSAALCCANAHAQVPHQINYQGYLTTATGAPVSAPVSMVLKLYNVSTGGTALYTETQSVNVTNGVFNVIVGSVTSLPLPFDVPYWLGVTVGADVEMTPRQPIMASAYAIRSATTEALAPGATVPASQITGAIGSAASFTGNLVGDVTGTQGATVASTVGGVSAANVATGANLANAATSANTANAIVKRDASGNFSAAAITTAGVIESQSGGVKFPDGTTQITAMKAARNVIVVSPSGGHFTTISAALASILDASTTNRYLVYVGPGTYTETVTMKQFVDIQGAGELATKITQVGNAAGTPTVAGASNAELRFLTVENTGGFDFAIAMRNISASPRITNVTLSASAGADTEGIRNVSSSPTIRFSTVSASSAGGNYGVYNSDSSPTIESSFVSASGGTNFGIYNATAGGSFTLKVTNSKVVGSFYTINTIPSYTTLVVASQLSGGPVGGGGTVTCIATYDENFVAPGYNTCP